MINTSQNNNVIRIVIQEPINRVRVSSRQRARYYIMNYDGSISSGKKMPVKYVKPERLHDIERKSKVTLDDLKPEYVIGVFKGNNLYTNVKFNMSMHKEYTHPSFKLILCDRAGNKIIANPQQAGTPSFVPINAQTIYSGNIVPEIRAKVMTELKKSFIDEVRKLKPLDNDIYPLRGKLYLFDTVNKLEDGNSPSKSKGGRWDVGNRCMLYGKAMLDLLGTGAINYERHIDPIIFDDDRLHVTEDPQGGIFCPIDDTQVKRMLVFILYKDNYLFPETNDYEPIEVKEIEVFRRELINSNPYYNERNNNQ